MRIVLPEQTIMQPDAKSPLTRMMAGQPVYPPPYRDGADLRAEAIDFLRGRWLLGLLLALLVFGLCAIAIALLAPVYQATALVSIESPFADDLVGARDTPISTSPDTMRVLGETELFSSPAVLGTVVDALDLTDDDEFALSGRVLEALVPGRASTAMTADQTRSAVIDTLGRSVAVERRRASAVVAVSARSRDAGKAAAIANAVADAYIESEATRRSAFEARLQQALIGQIDQLGDSISSYESGPETGPVTLEENIFPDLDLLREVQGELRERLVNHLTASGLREELQLAGSRIVSPAIVPSRPVYPKPQLLLALAGLVSGFAGCFLAWLLDRNVFPLRRGPQLKFALGTSEPVEIPGVSGLATGLEAADQVVVESRSQYAESVRRCLLNLRLDTPSSPAGIVVMVVSALPREGRTETAVALARSVALSGRKTLLIDADTASPSIGRVIGRDSAVIDLRTAMDHVLKNMPCEFGRDPKSAVSFVSSEPVGAQETANALAGKSFSEFLSKVQARFDVIIVDTSPLLASSLTQSLLRQADAVLFLARRGYTRRADAVTGFSAVREFCPPRTTVVVAFNFA